jgi:hypothetical protein
MGHGEIAEDLERRPTRVPTPSDSPRTVAENSAHMNPLFLFLFLLVPVVAHAQTTPDADAIRQAALD